MRRLVSCVVSMSIKRNGQSDIGNVYISLIFFVDLKVKINGMDLVIHQCKMLDSLLPHPTQPFLVAEMFISELTGLPYNS